MQKVIVVTLVLAVLFGFLFWKFGPDFNNSPQNKGPVELIFWGFSDESVIKPLVTEYQLSHAGVKVTYAKQNPQNYRTRVQAQIGAGQGPDIFEIHNSWLPMFDGDLFPSPTEVFSLSEIRNNFYPVVENSLSKDGKIYGVPTNIDGLVLFVNEDILSGIGAQTPQNWQQFAETASKVTVRDQGGSIKTAGAALGATVNVDYWSDLLGLLLIQQGANLNSPSAVDISDVLSFYTSFIIDPKKKTWDVTLPSSTAAFASGKLAFYFAPSSIASQIKTLNPNLNFKIVPVPQLPEKRAAWASFWAETVSARSKHPKEAWQFIEFITSRSSARVDQAIQFQADPIFGPYVTQGPYYKFWYLSSNTFDLGINDDMIKVWEVGVNNTLQTGNAPSSAQTLEIETKKVLDKYLNPVPTPSGQTR